MPVVVVDLVLLLIMGGILYALTSEGAWGAALMFFNVLFSSVITLNFYEPLAALMAKNTPSMIGDFSDVVCLMGIFFICVLLLRITTDSLAPSMVRLPPALYHIGRIGFGLGGAIVATGMLILGLHTTPSHKKIFGSMNFDHKPPFKLGFDYEMLAFFQRITGTSFSHYGNEPDPFGSYGTAYAFDRRAKWLIDHQNARSFGEGPVVEPEPEPAGGSAAETKSEGGGGNQQQGGGGSF